MLVNGVAEFDLHEFQDTSVTHAGNIIYQLFS